MLSTLVDILTSSGAGAGLGLFGSWLTKREERLGMRLAMEKELALAKLTKEEAALEMEHALAMADKEHVRALTEGEMKTEIAEISAFRESLKQNTVKTGLAFIDTLRGLMRPLITAYLLLLATWISLELSSLTGGFKALPAPLLASLFEDIIQEILFLTTTAVTWWFGSRPSSNRAR